MDKFFTDAFTEEESNIIVFGVPSEENSLESLREASWFVEPFDIDKRKNLLEKIKIFDGGNFGTGSLDEIKNKTQEITSSGKVSLMLSSSHLSTLFAAPVSKDAKILVFDAHTDTKDEYLDEKLRALDHKFATEKLNGATWLRRFCETENPDNVMLIGVRSCDEDDIKFLEEKKIKYITTSDIKHDINKAKSAIWTFTQDSDVYISVDIDVFDPSVAPAVDYPEPNGLLFNEFQNLINEVNGRVVGIDMCCLKPISGNQVTEFLAVKCIFEMLGLVK